MHACRQSRSVMIQFLITKVTVFWSAMSKILQIKLSRKIFFMLIVQYFSTQIKIPHHGSNRFLYSNNFACMCNGLASFSGWFVSKITLGRQLGLLIAIVSPQTHHLMLPWKHFWILDHNNNYYSQSFLSMHLTCGEGVNTDVHERQNCVKEMCTYTYR